MDLVNPSLGFDLVHIAPTYNFVSACDMRTKNFDWIRVYGTSIYFVTKRITNREHNFEG